MKQSILLLLAISMMQSAFAQDYLKTKKGDEVPVKIISVTDTKVEYKPFYYQEGGSLFFDKKDIQSIKYADGRLLNFDAPVVPVSSGINTYSSSAPSTSSADALKGLEKLTGQITELNKGQTDQTKALTETLNALNANITSLKTAIEQGNTETKKQNEEVSSKLNSLNSSVKELNETTQTKSGAEANAIVPRKFGMGVSFITNYLLNAFSDDEGAPIINQYNGLFMGAGFNLIVSTRMDKKVGFRYEPEFSVASSFSRSKDGNDISANRISIFSFGSRFLGVARRNRVNIYAGPSITIFGVVASLRENELTTTSAMVGAGFGLHFGGEYLVHPNFGINMESGMQLYGLFPKGGYAEGVFSTYGRLGGRFYF
ncbi:MAG: hypothetical protein U0T74_09380 [Chitinophagales bacterium]